VAAWIRLERRASWWPSFRNSLVWLDHQRHAVEEKRCNGVELPEIETQTFDFLPSPESKNHLQTLSKNMRSKWTNSQTGSNVRAITRKPWATAVPAIFSATSSWMLSCIIEASCPCSFRGQGARHSQRCEFCEKQN